MTTASQPTYADRWGDVSRPTPDPRIIAAVTAAATARSAHHEAGHAVAAVSRGGRLTDVYLRTADLSTHDDSADTPGGTVHLSHRQDAPFVTFAGPWAQAMWTVENDPDVDDVDEALDYAWDDNADGDTAKYQARVEILETVAAQLGFGRVGPRWEIDWDEELTELWPAICDIAALLIDGKPVSHDTVQAAIERAALDSD